MQDYLPPSSGRSLNQRMVLSLLSRTFAFVATALRTHSRNLRLYLTAALKSANRKKEIDLKAASLTPPAASELLNLTLLGLRHSTADVETYKKRVNSFVSVFMRGLRSESLPR